MFELDKKKYTYFFILYSLSSLNNWVFKFITPLEIYSATNSMQMMAISYGLLFTPNIIAPLIANLLENMLKKTILLLLNLIGLFFCFFAFTFSKSHFINKTFLLVIFVISAILTMYQIIIQSTIKYIFKNDSDKVSRGIAFFDSLFPAIAPIIGAAILSYLSYKDSFFMIGSIFIIAIFILLKINIAEIKIKKRSTVISKTLKGFKLIKKNIFVNYMMRRFFFSSISLHGFQSMLTFFLINKFNLNDVQLGVFFSLSSIGLMVGMKIGEVIYKKKHDKWIIISTTGIVCSLCLMLIPVVNNLYIASISWGIVILLNSINLIIFYTERQKNYHQDDVVSVISASYIIIYSAIPLGAALSYILSKIMKISNAMITLGVFLLITGLYFLYEAIKFRNKKQETT